MRLRVMRVLSRMNVGGPSVQAAVLFHGLDRQRFEQRIYVGEVAPGEAEHMSLRDGEVEVVRLPGLGRSVRPGDDARALAALIRQMREFRPHIVHTHAAKAGALGRLAACLTGVPVRVHTFHGHLLNGYFGQVATQAVITAERLMARRTHRIISVGAQVRNELLQAGIGRPGQYSVVPPGVDLPPKPGKVEARNLLGVPSDVPVLAYVGRIAAIKRPDRLQAVFQLVRQDFPEARLLVCGDGEKTALLQQPGVHHLGWRADVETVYASADIVLLTSDNEGMPVSLIEAAHAGVPAVATRIGSVAEVVRDGHTGILCELDADSLAAAVVRLLGQPELRQQMGDNAAQMAPAKFGGARLVADVQRIYTDLATTHRLRPAGQPAQRTAPAREQELIS